MARTTAVESDRCIIWCLLSATHSCRQLFSTYLRSRHGVKWYFSAYSFNLLTVPAIQTFTASVQLVVLSEANFWYDTA